MHSLNEDILSEPLISVEFIWPLKILCSLPSHLFLFFMLKGIKASTMLECLSAHGLLSWHRQAYQLNSISYQLWFTIPQQKQIFPTLVATESGPHQPLGYLYLLYAMWDFIKLCAEEGSAYRKYN